MQRRVQTPSDPRPHAAALVLLALGGCAIEDRWWDGTSYVTTTLTGAEPPVTQTDRLATSVVVHEDEGGEHVTLHDSTGMVCALSPVGSPLVAGLTSLKFERWSQGCVFATPAGPARGSLAAGSGTLGADDALSLDLSFTLAPALAGAPSLAGSARVKFTGAHRAR